MSRLDQVNDRAPIKDVLIEKKPTIRRDRINVADAQLGKLPTNLGVIAPGIRALLHASDSLIELWRQDFDLTHLTQPLWRHSKRRLSAMTKTRCAGKTKRLGSV